MREQVVNNVLDHQIDGLKTNINNSETSIPKNDEKEKQPSDSEVEKDEKSSSQKSTNSPTIKELRATVRDLIKKYPQIREEIKKILKDRGLEKERQNYSNLRTNECLGIIGKYSQG